MTDSRDPGSLHPLFRAMVLMGGSLALQCGGNVNHRATAEGGTTSGGAESGGSQAAGGQFSGGTTGSGGALIINTGGSPEAVTPGPFACPPAQWDCSATPPSCWGRLYELPPECACDRTRPRSPADCIDSDWVCRHATTDSQQRPLTTAVDFECMCAPHASSCRAACEAAFGYSAACQQLDSATNAVLCDCAVIVLR